MAKAAVKAAPKKVVAKATKRDASLCHFGAGSYGSPESSKKCPDKLVEGKQLCAKHEAAWRVVAKARAGAKKHPKSEEPAKVAAAQLVSPAG